MVDEHIQKYVRGKLKEGKTRVQVEEILSVMGLTKPEIEAAFQEEQKASAGKESIEESFITSLEKGPETKASLTSPAEKPFGSRVMTLEEIAGGVSAPESQPMPKTTTGLGIDGPRPKAGFPMKESKMTKVTPPVQQPVAVPTPAEPEPVVQPTVPEKAMLPSQPLSQPVPSQLSAFPAKTPIQPVQPEHPTIPAVAQPTIPELADVPPIPTIPKPAVKPVAVEKSPSLTRGGFPGSSHLTRIKEKLIKPKPVQPVTTPTVQPVAKPVQQIQSEALRSIKQELEQSRERMKEEEAKPLEPHVPGPVMDRPTIIVEQKPLPPAPPKEEEIPEPIVEVDAETSFGPDPFSHRPSPDTIDAKELKRALMGKESTPESATQPQAPTATLPTTPTPEPQKPVPSQIIQPTPKPTPTAIPAPQTIPIKAPEPTPTTQAYVPKEPAKAEDGTRLGAVIEDFRSSTQKSVVPPSVTSATPTKPFTGLPATPKGGGKKKIVFVFLVLILMFGVAAVGLVFLPDILNPSGSGTTPDIPPPEILTKSITASCDASVGTILVSNQADEQIIPKDVGLTIQLADGNTYKDDSIEPIPPLGSVSYDSTELGFSIESNAEGVVYGNNVLVADFSCAV